MRSTDKIKKNGATFRVFHSEKKILLLLVIHLLVFICNAQVNLVPNPGFENLDTCFFGGGCLGGVPYGLVQPWESNSSDVFNTCSSDIQCDVPSNHFGFQYAHTGNGYVGELCFYTFSNNREFIQVQLTDSLITQHKYCVTFYVSLANIYSLAVNNMGLYFSDTHTDMSTVSNLNMYTPQIRDTTIITDTTGWTLVSGEYEALGGEQYIIIGNFNTNATTNTFPVTNVMQSYYYIDDVSIVDCTGSGLGVGELGIKNEELRIMPNPAIDKINVEVSKSMVNGHLSIVNLLGEKIYSTIISNTKIEIDISRFANGVYFVEVQSENGVMRKKFVKE